MPGHSLPLAALGVFILWFGWYGFNPGSQLAFQSTGDIDATMHIAVTTSLAAAAGGLCATLFSWFLYGKPDLSMGLNGILGGLVGITACCDCMSNHMAIVVGIVAGGLPIAVGAALAIKKLKKPNLVVCFFGDGANNEGAFHESLNMASIWQLPVVFVCENNGYGMSMSAARSTAAENVADRAAAYAMPGVIVDGNDLSAVAEASQIACDRARAGGGPTLIENKTYRWRGHSKSDRNRYRTKEEIEAWIAKDPIIRFQDEMKSQGIVDDAAIAEIRAAVEREIEAGLEFAKASPPPRIEDLTQFVYTDPAK